MSGRAVDRTRVGLLAASHAVDDIYQGAVPALLPFFIADRHYSYAAATGLTFAATVLSSVIQPVFGVLTDRHNLRWLVPAGLTVAGAGIGLSGLAGSYPLTWLAIALSGIGVPAFHPEAARAARVASGDSQQAMSVFSVGGNAGFAAGPLFVAVVLAAAGPRGTVFLAVPAVLTGVTVYLVLRRSSHPAAEQPGGRPVGAQDDWHGFALLTSAVIVRSIFFFGLSSLLALYVGTGLHGGRQLGEAALTIMLAAGTVTGGRLADRYGRLPVIRASFAVTALGLAAIVLTRLPWILLPIAFTGFALNQSFSLTVTLGQDYLPTRIGTSSGVTLGLAISVGGLFTPVLGALADATSLRLAVTALVAFPLIGLTLALRLRRPRSLTADDTPSGVPPATPPRAFDPPWHFSPGAQLPGDVTRRSRAGGLAGPAAPGAQADNCAGYDRRKTEIPALRLVMKPVRRSAVGSGAREMGQSTGARRARRSRSTRKRRSRYSRNRGQDPRQPAAEGADASVHRNPGEGHFVKTK